MNKRSFIITTGAALLIAMLATGYAAIAAEYGSADDPLITQSYLDNVLTPKVQKQISEALASAKKSYQSAVDSKLAGLNSRIDDELSDLADDQAFIDAVAQAGDASASVGQWNAVTVVSGKTVKLSAGAEVVIRSGSITCVASGGEGLTNVSLTYKLKNGEKMTAGYHYKATTEGAGFKATGEAKVLVLGEYTMA